MKQVFSENAPQAVGPYSQAMISNGFVFTSGQLGVDKATGKIQGGIAEQTRRAIENLAAVLSAAGSGTECVVKTTCCLADIKDFAVFNEIYAEYFTSKCARTLIEAGALPKGALVEIDAIAELR